MYILPRCKMFSPHPKALNSVTQWQHQPEILNLIVPSWRRMWKWWSPPVFLCVYLLEYSLSQSEGLWTKETFVCSCQPHAHTHSQPFNIQWWIRLSLTWAGCSIQSGYVSKLLVHSSSQLAKTCRQFLDVNTFPFFLCLLSPLLVQLIACRHITLPRTHTVPAT